MAQDLEKRITAKMVLDSTGFNSSIKGINNQLKLTQSELKNASSEVGLFSKNSEKLKGVQEALAKQVELHAKKVDVYKESIEKSTAKMNDNIKERDKLKSSLENANKSYDEAIKLYGKESTEAQKAKAQVDSLTDEYKKKEKAIESNAKQINNYETNLNKANTELNKTKIELNKVNDELGKSNNKWLSASETLRNSSEKLKNIGSTVSSAGDTILKISAPLVGAGVASLKFATDFQDSMAKVSTISDESEVSIGDLRKGILKLSNDTGIASTEIANNVYDAISAGQSTGDAINFVTDSTKLAKAGYAEASQSLDLLTTILNSYGLESKEVAKVSDILIETQNKGKVTVGELSTSMGKVIPTANSLGVNLEQVATGYAIMTSKGIKAAETTTYMNSMFNEMGKSGTTANEAIQEATGKTFPQLIKEGKTVGDVLNSMNEYAKKNGKSLADMFGSAEAGKAALILSTNSGKDFNSMLKDMGNSAGATDEAFKKVSDTTGERFKKSLNQLKNEAIRLGDAATPILEKGSELIGKIASKLGEMDAEQLKNITSIGLFTVGLGGVLKIGGGVVGSIGSIAGGLSKLSGALGGAKIATEGVGVAAGVAGGATGLGGLGTALGEVAAAATPFLLAGAAVAGVGYGIYKGLSQETIPVVDLFADRIEYTAQTMESFESRADVSMKGTVTKISEGTKQAVGAYVNMDNDIKNTLDSLYINSTTITENIKTDTISKYNSMFSAVKTEMANNNQEQLTIMNQYFQDFRGMDEKEKADLISRLQSHNQYEISQIDNKELRIKEILDLASKERRALTIDEQQEIASIQSGMKETAVKILSESETEAKVILQRMKDYDGRITAEQASEHIKKLNESKDKSIAAANDEYDKRVATIIKMRDEAKVITDEQAEIMINNAKRQRDEVVKKAEEMKTDSVKKITDMNADLVKNVDTETGKILTFWDKLKNWWNGWDPKPKNAVINITEKSNTAADYVDRKGGIPQRWTGDRNFQGGKTTLHERGYEVYELERGTRIYNHDASEDLVRKAAENIAIKISEGMLEKSRSNGDINVTQYISSPTPSPSEIARQSKNALRELALNL